MGLMLFQQLSGHSALLFNLVTVFGQSGTSLDPHLSTIIVGFLQTACILISAVLIDLTGRRQLLLASGTVLTVSLSILGLYFFLKIQNMVDLAILQWVPLTAILIYFAGYAIGFGPIPWLVNILT
jgi:hypothetical protein